MLHDEASDIFGWPYLVMPKMPGHCFGERDILKSLGAEDRRGVAEAMGAMLAEMARLRAPCAGSIDIDTLLLTPFPGGFTQHAIAELRLHARDADASGALADEDRQWIAAAEARALSAGARPGTYVHCDYKLNNLTVSKGEDGWRVTGLFDLHEAKFGDGALDLVRQACSYLDTEPALARVFVESYRAHMPADPQLSALMPLYVLNDRMKLWNFFTRPGVRAAWTEGTTFRGWAERYSEGILSLF
jgi:aminoglycoside phosphotransferase (APT) family kinase protein